MIVPRSWRPLLIGLGAPTQVTTPFMGRSTLSVNENRKKGACLLFKKESLYMISSEEVSSDISFFIS
jgi:hypothetical protein